MSNVIWCAGRPYRNAKWARHLIEEATNARRVLDMPAVTYVNGKNSHEAMGEVLEAAENLLTEYLTVVA